MAAKQAALPFAKPAKKSPSAGVAPTADAEAMARRRSSIVHLFPGAAVEGWVRRRVDTPAEAMNRYLPLIGQPPERLDVKIGADPSQLEVRLTADLPGFHPRHLLAVIEGLTLDEARTALARLKA